MRPHFSHSSGRHRAPDQHSFLRRQWQRLLSRRANSSPPRARLGLMAIILTVRTETILGTVLISNEKETITIISQIIHFLEDSDMNYHKIFCTSFLRSAQYKCEDPFLKPSRAALLPILWMLHQTSFRRRI